MRPLEVQMAGFGAFRDETTVDFRDVELMALVGSTGSGKSTVIDAVTFALFGSVARYDDRRLIAPIIHQLCTEARVQLEFEVGGETYKAVRVVKRTATGGATTKAAQLEKGDEVVASSVKEVTPGVEELLGMDFEQFTKTVVLPQGDFALFLQDPPSDRQELLVRLLDLGVYERMGRAARHRAAVAKSQIDLLDEQLERAEEVSDERLAELETRAGELDQARTRMLDEQVSLEQMTKAVEALWEIDRELGEQVDALAKLTMPDEVETLGGNLTAAAAVLKTAVAETKAARAARTDAAKKVVEGPDQAGCARLLEAYEELRNRTSKTQELVPVLAGAAKALNEAEKNVEAAQSETDDADRRLAAAQLAAGASGIRAALVVGEPCPVCDQVVEDIPDHDRKAEVASAENAQKAARKKLAAAQTSHKAANKKHLEIEAKVSSTRERIAELHETLEGAPAEEKVRADHDQAQRLADAKVESDRVLDEKVAAEGEARSALESLTKSERELRSGFGKARDSVASLTPPAAGEESLRDDWLALARWAEAETKRVEKDRGTAAKELAMKAEERDAVRQRIVALCQPFVDGEVPANPVEHLTGLAADAAGDLKTARARRKDFDELREKSRGLQGEQQVAQELGKLLSASGFERWLMEEAMLDLVDRATVRLLELSGGQYSLIAHETDFRIQDHNNADEIRDARTLSGGETFLASLSLALALADSIAELTPEGSPRLESIFLDEGFGTLDPETLDLVASAIEELGAAGRMVGLITHIRELADRMPVRFEVTKGARTASVERIEV